MIFDWLFALFGSPPHPWEKYLSLLNPPLYSLCSNYLPILSPHTYPNISQSDCKTSHKKKPLYNTSYTFSLPHTSTHLFIFFLCNTVIWNIYAAFIYTVNYSLLLHTAILVNIIPIVVAVTVTVKGTYLTSQFLVETPFLKVNKYIVAHITVFCFFKCLSLVNIISTCSYFLLSSLFISFLF